MLQACSHVATICSCIPSLKLMFSSAGWMVCVTCPHKSDSGVAWARPLRGNLGDVKPVGEGVWEMREFFGPGWRMYYVQRGDVLIVMLGGGDKSSQERDIATARAIAKEINL